MDDRRRCTTVRQLEIMIEFMEGHLDLALGRVRSKESRAVATRLWREFAIALNTEGPARTGKEWSKVWNDYKSRVKSKITSMNASRQGTGGGPSTTPVFSVLEERAANIIGRDVGPLPNVRHDHFNLNDGDAIVIEELEDNIQAEIASQPLLINEADVLPSSPVHIPVPASPAPSLTGQTPTPQNSPRRTVGRIRRVRERPRTDRASHQPTLQTGAQFNRRSALEESRSMILHIETLRAEAAVKYSAAALSFAESFRLIAESVDRYSQRQYQQHQQQHQQQSGVSGEERFEGQQTS